ncbi:hypothetical protein M9458_018338 [Cirrhinus mrigala]|uniref:Uncharacterized protein n=1 Tax=Cirrhinus mrigala TaxID=683832 RepID=A0ABD0QKA1_CIRMR
MRLPSGMMSGPSPSPTQQGTINPAPGRKNPNLCCALSTRPCLTASEHTSLRRVH